MLLRSGRLARRSWPRLLLREACPGWASGEPKVRPLLEDALGRGVNLPWSTVPARDWARARRDRVPRVDRVLSCVAPIRPLQLCADGVYQLSLGVLGVPLIMVPDSSPRATKGVLALTWRLCRTFLQGDRPFSVAFCSGGCARAHPPGVAPEASKEWFDSFEVLMRFAMLRPVWLFPHASWP
jgi:hypothetical protein